MDRWPNVQLDAEVFAAFLKERGGDRLESARQEELYLACACLRGDPAAVNALDAEFLPEVDRALARLDEPRSFVDDVRQHVRRLLFAPEPGKRSKLESFSGRGPLGGWIRAVAVRTASNLKRAGQREQVEASERLAQAPALTSSPELEVLKSRYRGTFESALKAALKALPTRERTVLRLNAIEGLSIDQIGNLYQVHRTTVARWIASAKKSIVDETHRVAKSALKLSTGDLQSLMNVVRSDLDVSLSRLLRERTKDT